ncbi:Eukaryotic translation initiation factor 5A-1 [Capsicum annuum]|uniref:Eukaryotic translation initiation factor 5A-1 n=1 Tax=Capsicum annuum TaxID=4072 RepID=A0A2G3A4C8_CAPAN|nr:Eukaryotic translation initiation factor 5A-1 [Capsicum annuum]
MVIDIFTGKNLEDIVPSSHNCDVPHVNRIDYQLIDIYEDGFVSCLTKNGNTKDELRLPTDDTLLAQVKDGFAEEGPGFVCDVRHGGGADLWYQGYWSQNLIDLAGFESSKIETTGLRRKEESYINKSLLTLGTKAVMLWTYEPFERDVRLANEALKSRKKTITRLQVIVEISCASSPNHLIAVRQTYCGLFNHSLEEDIAENVPIPVHKILIGQVRSYRYDKELVDPDTANAESTILHESIRTK